MAAPSITLNCNRWAHQLYGATERYVLLHSGRAAGKDYEVGIWVCWRMLQPKPIKVMCVRQFQSSIDNSIKSLFETVIREQGLEDMFKITRDEIKSLNGSVMHFKGAERNLESIKGWQDYSILIINEAQSISSASWEIIKPTMRREDSQIVVIMNPRYPSDAIARELLGPDLNGFDRPDVRIISLSYEDNEYLSETIKYEIEVAKKGDPVLFSHIWGGGYDLGSLRNPFDRQTIIRSRRDIPAERKGRPYITAIDIATTENLESDYTVAIKADEYGTLLDFVRFQKRDYHVAVNQLRSFLGDTTVLIDATGVGQTIADMIGDYHHTVIPMTWSLTLKRSMIGSLAGVLSAGDLSIPTDERWDWLQEELLHYEQKETSTGEPTTKYGAAANFHDDGVSALMMYAHHIRLPKDDGEVIYGSRPNNQGHWRRF